MGLPCCPASLLCGVSRPIAPTVPHCTPGECVGSHSPQWAFPGLGVQRPLSVGWTPERRGGLSIIWLLVSSGGPVGREQHVLCEGSLGEGHLLHIVEFWWGRGAGEASAQSREPVRGQGGFPGLLSGCWQPESPSPARPAQGRKGRVPMCAILPSPSCLRLSGCAARWSRQAHCIVLAQPSTPGR